MCCVQPVLLQEAPVVWETDGESPGIVLELEWNSHQDKPLGIPISKSNDCLDNSVNFSTALTYTETDLVHVPITGIPDLAESSMEVVVSNGVMRKVRLVNDLILVTGSVEQRGVIEKAKGNNRRRKVKPVSGNEASFLNCSLSDSYIQARQHAILHEAMATVQLGALVGVETVGREEKLITDLSRIIARHSQAH
ncbi:hypothetical protein V6N13_125079 [Hibiscus sabdariffa]